MPDHQERTVGAVRVRIDRSQCVGFADCVAEAPEAFALDAEGMVAFVTPDVVERERLVRACDACPVDAIMVFDAEGRQLVP